MHNNYAQRLCSRLTALWRYINFVLLVLLLLLLLQNTNFSDIMNCHTLIRRPGWRNGRRYWGFWMYESRFLPRTSSCCRILWYDAICSSFGISMALCDTSRVFTSAEHIQHSQSVVKCIYKNKIWIQKFHQDWITNIHDSPTNFKHYTVDKHFTALKMFAT